MQRASQQRLAQCVEHALNAANRLLGAVSDTSLKRDIAYPQRSLANFKEKAVAETGLLLMCVEPVKGANANIEAQFHEVARRLVPLVRDSNKLFAICLEPSRSL